MSVRDRFLYFSMSLLFSCSVLPISSKYVPRAPRRGSSGVSPSASSLIPRSTALSLSMMSFKYVAIQPQFSKWTPSSPCAMDCAARRSS